MTLLGVYEMPYLGKNFQHGHFGVHTLGRVAGQARVDTRFLCGQHQSINCIAAKLVFKSTKLKRGNGSLAILMLNV